MTTLEKALRLAQKNANYSAQSRVVHHDLATGANADKAYYETSSSSLTAVLSMRDAT